MATVLERLGVVPGGQPQGAWPDGLLVKAPTLEGTPLPSPDPQPPAQGTASPDPTPSP